MEDKQPSLDYSTENLPTTLPILPLFDATLFPKMVLPLVVMRGESVQLIDEAMAKDRMIGLVVAKKQENVKPDPDSGDMAMVGTVALILKMAKTEDNRAQLLVQGLSRFRVKSYQDGKPYLVAAVEYFDDIEQMDNETEALMANVIKQFARVVQLSPGLPQEMGSMATSIKEPGTLADMVASTINSSAEEKQQILEIQDSTKRLKAVTKLVHHQLEILELGNKIQSQVKGDMDKRQREYYLRQQLKAIKEELGETDDAGVELEEYRAKIKDRSLPELAVKEAERELDRFVAHASLVSRVHGGHDLPGLADRTALERKHRGQSGYQKGARGTGRRPFRSGKGQTPHYRVPGGEKNSNRIPRGPSSVLRDLREPARPLWETPLPGPWDANFTAFHWAACGTRLKSAAIGAPMWEPCPAGSFKVSGAPAPTIRFSCSMKSTRWDPISGAIRHRPCSRYWTRNRTSPFSDHYLDVPFDLSKVMFITTANVLDTIPSALRDRMEVLELLGYTEDEKVKIASRYLIPRQREAHGLKAKEINITTGAIRHIISGYTREAGLRNLEREIASVCRGVAAGIAEGKIKKATIKIDDLAGYLGPVKLQSEAKARMTTPGVAMGLAWTPTGGDLLFIEATAMKGKKGLTLTGQLGDVMKESATAALSFIRANAKKLGVDENFFESHDIHIHVPAGAIPKDGPSAGVTMLTALVSLLKNKTIKKDLAMTGEITLRGQVLPVGGVKEKVLAAHRAGIKTILLPKWNEKDLIDIPAKVKDDIEFHFMEKMIDVLKIAINI